MTSDPETRTEPRGRPITLTPLAPGLWLIIGGTVIAALGPLFGFLLGSIAGPTDDSDLDPIFLFMMIGIVVGGLGVGMVILGGMRHVRHRRTLQTPVE